MKSCHDVTPNQVYYCSSALGTYCYGRRHFDDTFVSSPPGDGGRILSGKTISYGNRHPDFGPRSFRLPWCRPRHDVRLILQTLPNRHQAEESQLFRNCEEKRSPRRLGGVHVLHALPGFAHVRFRPPRPFFASQSCSFLAGKHDDVILPSSRRANYISLRAARASSQRVDAALLRGRRQPSDDACPRIDGDTRSGRA